MNDFNFIEPAPSSANTRSGWQIIFVKARIDAFSQNDLVKEVRDLCAQGHRKIALDLKNNRFLSFNAIRFCSDFSHELMSEGGALVLIGCAEKTKRHFEIYGSLDRIRIIRTELEI
jgi:anti-anti-sigma regulatory factor